MKQVFYVEDPVDSSWSVVLTSTTRDYKEVFYEDGLGDTNLEHPPFCSTIPTCDATDIDVGCSNQRLNVEKIWVKK